MYKACLSVSRAVPVPGESVVHMTVDQVNHRPIGDGEWSDIQATVARIADVRELPQRQKEAVWIFKLLVHPLIITMSKVVFVFELIWVIVSTRFLLPLSGFWTVPSGKLVQIEHALTAVGSGQTSLGIKAANGVVIATEKKLPSILVDETSVQKIQILTPNIGVVYSGMGPDFRVLVRKSRKQAEQYHRLYKEPIPVTQLVRETAAVMQEFTQSGGVRPFGVSLLVAGFDDKGPQLYQVDPSGSYFSWKASAMGKNVSNAKTFLEKRYTEDMELDDAVHTAILTLKEGFEGQISSKTLRSESLALTRNSGKVLTPAEIDDYLAEVE
ncbi:hypothetical protein EZV62_006176 [Acer yangbiense]|uniref:Proteasome alpha-type subunits domain-containing protein n=1 Tax=Acer yangbiense TaxID=1000413 RepID=A0A5C7IPM7_9ROSI|nr:hypothetical protein EZV62_006176 [Acer yangbiense]